MLTLYARQSKDITLAEALKNCAFLLSQGGVALLYSPSCCQFAKIQNDGSLTNQNNEFLDLKDIFEARVFNQNSELRWLNQANEKGKAVLISEKKDVFNYLSDSIADLPAIDVIPQQYILWGKGVENKSNPDWGKLAESRIGTISVPVSLTENQRVYLKAIEYLQADRENGNVSVVEERLTALEVK